MQQGIEFDTVLLHELGTLAADPLPLVAEHLYAEAGQLAKEPEQTSSDEEDYIMTRLVDPPHKRIHRLFLGKSSVYPLIRDAENSKEARSKKKFCPSLQQRREYWDIPAVRGIFLW